MFFQMNKIVIKKKYVLSVIFFMTMMLVLLRKPPFVLNSLLPGDFSLTGLTLWFLVVSALCMFFKVNKHNISWAKVLGVALVAHFIHSIAHILLHGSDLDLRFSVGIFFIYLLKIN